MAGLFTAYFESEHQVLGQLLKKCRPPSGDVDVVAFDVFRRRLLQRIAAEERVLFPALVAKLGRRPLYRSALAKDHAGLVAICAPTPHREWVDGLWEQLDFHHAIEMADAGFCAQCDEFLGEEGDAVLAEAAALPQIDVPPFEEDQGVRRRIAELLVATGIESK